MRKDHHLSEEMGRLDRLIAAISSEIESERATANQQDDLLREMEAALAELRLARGVRLMLLNAYGISTPADAPRAGRAIRKERDAGWPRTGRHFA